MSKIVLDDTGERLIAKGNEKTLTYGEHLSRYSSVAGLVKNKIVLDIACGTGYGSAMIADAGANKVIAVDNSPQAIGYAKQNYKRKNIQYINGNALNIPVKDSSVDVVVSLETIEHLHEPELFVKEVKRVLKKEGIFIVSTPNDDEFMDGNDFHVHEFQFKELHSLIEDNFKSAKYYYQGTYFAAALQSEESFKNSTTSSLPVTKTFSQDVKKAIYFIAIASAGKSELDLGENVVLADMWSTKDDIERTQANNEKIRGLIQQNKDQLSDIENLRTTLANLRSSTSWRVTKPLRFLARMIAGRR